MLPLAELTTVLIFAAEDRCRQLPLRFAAEIRR